jgi:hypothetical protein
LILKKVGKGLLAACLAIGFFDFQQFQNFWKPFDTESPEIGAALRFLDVEAKKDEAVFCDYEAAPAAFFYANTAQEPVRIENLAVRPFAEGSGNPKLTALHALRDLGFRKIWLVWPHKGRPDYIQDLGKTGGPQIVREIFFHRCSAILVEF